jgi:hypothetical protein
MIGVDSLWQKLWIFMVNLMDKNLVFIMLSGIPSLAVYYCVFAGTFLIFDLYQKPEFLKSFKTQPTMNVPVDHDQSVLGNDRGHHDR